MKQKIAYIDPGTGGMIVGSIWNTIIAILTIIGIFFLKYFLRPVKNLLSKISNFLKQGIKYNSKFLLITTLIIIVGYVINTSNLSGEKQTMKIILVGIDAMDPKIVEKLMNEGKLPNFKKLEDAGGYSQLETTIPPESPVAWSAAATGVNPGKYGIFDFIGRDPKTYLPKLNLAEEVKGLTGTKYKSAMRGIPFWRITSDAGIPTTVIRWPVTFPPEKIKGNMLSGLGTVDIKGFLNSYSFYTTENLEKRQEDTGKIVRVSKHNNEIETSIFGPMVRSGNDLTESKVPMKIKLLDGSAIIQVADTEHKVNTDNWSDWIRTKFRADFLTEVYGIFKIYLLGIEPFNMYVTSVQIDPENPVVEITYPKEYGKELANGIGLFYTLGIPEDTKAVTENRIGKGVFLEQIKDIENERTKMFWHEFNSLGEGILAFAFDAGDRLQHIFWKSKVLDGNNNFTIPKEIEEYYVEKDVLIGKILNRMDNNTSLIVFSDHGFNSFERAVGINTWLAENGYMGLTKTIDANDSGGLFKYVDWSKTKAYSLGFASIFINMIGREGKGIVDEEGKNKLIDEIIGKLSKLTDPKTGKPAIANLYRGKEIYKGEYAKDAPDIVIGFEQGYRMSWQNAVGGLMPEIFADNAQEWVGDHLIDRGYVPGIIFTNFKIKKENPSLMDIAPTALSLLGLNVPRDMDGKSLV